MTPSTKPIPFSHLHTHSPEGSLLDGYMRIDAAIKQAQSWGMDALAITDHGTMAAHEKFYKACKKAGIHPVLGMEAYLTTDKTYKKADFDGIDYVHDAKGRCQYAFLDPNALPQGWAVVETIHPKAEMKEVMKDAREHYLTDVILATLVQGAPYPKPASLTRMTNAYIKEQWEKEQLKLCIQADSTRRDYFEWFPKSGHLLLLALNNEGYQNLLKLNEIGQLQGFYAKPRIDYADLALYGKGLAATTACLGSTVSKLILAGRLEEAKTEILREQSFFDAFYLELQPSDRHEQMTVNKQLIAWSEELQIPLIATSDVHMVYREDLPIHKIFTNIGSTHDDDDENDDGTSYYDFAYFMHPQQFLDYGIPPVALQNAYDLSHRCQVDFLEHTETKFPEYAVPEGYDFDSYLAKLAKEGLWELFLNKDYIEEFAVYEQRLQYELEIIAMKGLSAYFVVVWDYVNFAKNAGILVGPGRGSGAGSLVLYVIGVTNLDPIKYNLLFERMLNPERDSLPDVDVDFSYTRRHEVVEYLAEKYGSDHVAQIGTYTTMSTKTVLKDVGRVLGYDHNKINDLNKLIPSDNGKVMELSKAIEEIPAIETAAKENPELFNLALEIQSMPRGASIHPCGIQCAPVSLGSNIPLMRGKKGEIVTQYEGPVLESLGYVKFDILGLKNLSVIDVAVGLVKQRHGVTIDMHNLEPEDPNVFQMLQKGDTLGIFQIESPGMQDLFSGLNAVDFDALVAGVALYRPGPMDNIPMYQRRANGLEEVVYVTPEFEQFTKNTHGILVYQEQVMQLVQVMAGYSPGEADSFRKAIGKKKASVMGPALEELQRRLTDRGYAQDIISAIDAQIQPFVGYGFNLSHAAAYSMISYQTAYLKHYYPVEFFTALLSIFGSVEEKASNYIQDARNHEITVLGPELNSSVKDFSITTEQEILYGLGTIKGLPEAAIVEILENRPFFSLEDLLARTTKKKVNKKALNVLALSGALRHLDPKETNRMRTLAKLYALRGDKDDLTGDIRIFNKKAMLDAEREILKVYISGHPLEGVAKPIPWTEIETGEMIEGHCLISAKRDILTKNGQPMSFLTLDFLECQHESVLFPNLFASEYRIRKTDPEPVILGKTIQVGMILKIRGRFRYDFKRDDTSFVLEDIQIPIRINQKALEEAAANG